MAFNDKSGQTLPLGLQTVWSALCRIWDNWWVVLLIGGVVIEGFLIWVPGLLLILKWVIGVVIGIPVVVLLARLVRACYSRPWSTYTGFGEYRSPPKQDRDLQRRKTVWDWMQLLIVPAVLAGGALWFNAQQSQTSMQIARDQQQEAELQTYLDRMSDLLLMQGLAASNPPDVLRVVARARTLTVLGRMDAQRKRTVLRFLYEAGLITQQGSHFGENAIKIKVSLDGADLSGANLSGADLRGADLRGANLSRANLSEAFLEGADLSGADLSGADLIGAHVTPDQLGSAYSLSGTIMPNGSRHP